jgi:cytochrome c-type biogenesis protein
MMDTTSSSLGLAFLAGLVSFLSPCVLPIVPSYVSFITGMTLDELQADDRGAARREAAIHAGLFILGFSALFIALGASATALGSVLRRSLPLLQQVGGIVIVGFGLYMLGWLKVPALLRDRRVHFAAKPAGKAGTMVAGIAFGAGWTPCVGPVLASILMFASFETTMARGMLLLAVYSLGLGIPFFAAAVGIHWFLSGSQLMRRWLRPIERLTGAFLVLLGVLLFSGRFALLAGFFARFGQLIDLEI